MVNQSAFDFSVRNIEGEPVALDCYRGKVLLLVNVASRCGLTPQYADLEALYAQYRDRGLEVLGFPCNQFMNQEPGSEAEIQQFCQTQYGVQFPLFAKIEVNGSGRHPLYRWLTAAAQSQPGDIQWNFEKFLIDRTGQVAARFAPRVLPLDATLIEALERTLATTQ
ncbi:MAG: glutathione peroxidase [Pseudomonadales bacterium]|jgi:glutathione peroxidase|nr:glutathione peroxidase [Pseudomonadales bacterium]